MDPNILYKVIDINDKKRELALVETCNERSLCEKLAKVGCFVSKEQGEEKYYVICERKIVRNTD